MLGYLPLALELAAAHLSQFPSVTLAAYCRELVQHGALPVLDNERLQLDPRKLSTRHATSIRASFATQWASLRNPDARLLLRTSAELPEGAIMPVARLGLLSGFLEPESIVFGRVERAIRDLYDYSLAEEMQNGCARLHPLIRAFAAQQTGEGNHPRFREWCATNLAEAYEQVRVLNSQNARRGVDAIQEDLTAALNLVHKEADHDHSSTARIGSTSPLKLPGNVNLGREAPALWSTTLLGKGTSNDRLRRILRLVSLEAHNLRGWAGLSDQALFVQQIHNRAVELGFRPESSRTYNWLKDSRHHNITLLWRVGSESQGLVRTLVGHDAAVSLRCSDSGLSSRNLRFGRWQHQAMDNEHRAGRANSDRARTGRALGGYPARWHQIRLGFRGSYPESLEYQLRKERFRSRGASGFGTDCSGNFGWPLYGVRGSGWGRESLESRDHSRVVHFGLPSRECAFSCGNSSWAAGCLSVR